MRTFALALALLSTSFALAGGADPRPLFMFPGNIVGPTTTFTVDADFSKTKEFSHGEPVILMTVVKPNGDAYLLDSRPLAAGVKAHWEGKIPANGTYILRVVGGGGSSASYGKLTGPVRLVLTGNKQGGWNVSDGPPPVK